MFALFYIPAPEKAISKQVGAEEKRLQINKKTGRSRRPEKCVIPGKAIQKLPKSLIPLQFRMHRRNLYPSASQAKRRPVSAMKRIICGQSAGSILLQIMNVSKLSVLSKRISFRPSMKRGQSWIPM